MNRVNTPKFGTIFHNTRLPLQKWFLAISIILNAKKGVASRQLARDIEVTKDTAWRMQMQIRKAMGQYKELLRGIVEMDETYVVGMVECGISGQYYYVSKRHLNKYINEFCFKYNNRKNPLVFETLLLNGVNL